ncbi:hypothetical protein BK812_0092 [Pectobacterium phage A38]|uniref:Tape measure protein n=2 Tax=Cbunavirus A41 TaxID=2845779 RepID=A0A7I6HVA8_9CAUD|nr:tail length tape measure protein [Pectobacterium phage phiA41]APD19076.1 hypothetical protein BK812_0092 [Pectobacterium phage A38]ARB11031.1 hypothetical protein B4963_0092 [Pectobacterium phage phiA41]
MSGTEQLGQDIDVFAMSDDELSRLDISQYLGGTEPEEDPQPVKTTTTAPEPELEPEPGEVVDPKPGEEPEPEPKPGEGEDEPQPGAKPKGKAKDEPAADPKEKTETDPEPQNVPDHKAFYEALTKPFKANGRDLQITNPEEIITLMQMGANYNAKMAALKPNRRFMKMLEQNELLDEGKLGFLIDLSKRDPKAIAKLVQDSGFNLDEYDPEAQVDYKSQHVAPSSEAIELEDIVTELGQQPGFADVLTTVTTNWDPQSQEILGKNPQILRVLQKQKALGHFDQIQAEVEKQSLFGQANGMTTLQLYSAAEQKLISEGKLKGMAPQPEPKPAAANPAPVTPTAPAKPDTTAAKRAAAAPKQTVQGKSQPVVDNLFSLSDEEFAKIDPTKFK